PFDLKIGHLTHQDLGQMQMYVHYYDRYVKLEEESPPVHAASQIALVEQGVRLVLPLEDVLDRLCRLGLAVLDLEPELHGYSSPPLSTSQ
ncbi:MAG: DUF1016 family protein, partial [Atopobiaceae bacterium]|nr:DUF1016 family protein [Atopobiaceae bacterium]